jgi:CopG family nickel-responsive transcriptional regulator
MAGTITLVYDHSTPGLQKQLADLQHRHLSEVISSLHVHLMHAHTMEVILVQGPAQQLQRIADRMLTCRGVITGKLQLTAAIIPPLHPLPA